MRVGELRVINSDITDSTPCVVDLPPPMLGEHTEEVLRETAGYSDEEIEELRKANAI